MTLTTDEIAEVTRHNIEVWDRCAPTYAEGFEALTGGAIDVLLDLAGVGRGTVLLDIGTGPGTLIGPALARGAVVRAVDVAPRMVEEARRRHPSVEVELADAAALPVPDGSVDAVTLGFCLHHTGDPTTVLAEVHRVLRPGGRLALAVWAPMEELEAFGVGFGAVTSILPPGDDAPPAQPPALGDTPDAHADLLAGAGFVQPTARRLPLSWPLADGAALFDGFDRFIGLEGQPDDLRDRIRTRIDELVRERAGADGLAHLANPAIVAAAKRP
jgi:SAM-dependent methyltransferase